MKITRDGKEFELTFNEMILVYEEYQLDCMIEDVKNCYSQGEYDVDLSEDDISEVASFALHNLSKNDSYFEAYWRSVENALDNYIDDSYTDEEDDE